MYIYDMPYAERKQLCDVLDQNNEWEELGGYHMKFDTLTIKKLKNEVIRGNSPTDKLLSIWGHLNHTIFELFILLSRMFHYQAMMIIKKFVDKKYHVMIKGLDNDSQGDSELYHNIPRENFDKKDEKLLNSQKINPNVDLPPINELKLINSQRVNPVFDIPQIEVKTNSDTRDNNESVPLPEERNALKPMVPISRELTKSTIPLFVESPGGIRLIAYEELQVATNNWDETNLLGLGGFGKVFKGTWKCTQVAVKRIEQKKNHPQWEDVQITQTMTELHCLNAYRHDNILPLYGYNMGGPHPCLVYQYMAGGSLESRLKVRDPNKVLSWPTRLKIAIGTARGLQFLHTTGKNGLVHGDIKSANVLLDPCDMPRIGDFGMAREGPHSDYTKVSKLQGTIAYLPLELLRSNKFSIKVDTYSFGVVLFELATSMRASIKLDNKKVIYLRDHVVNYDGDILTLKDKLAEGYDNIFFGLMNMGNQCVSISPKERPEMVQVLLKLEQIEI